jgi:hypothetical protein
VHELVFFIVAFGQVDEDAFVIDAGGDTDGCAGELRGELVVAPRAQAEGGAVVPVC